MLCSFPILRNTVQAPWYLFSQNDFEHWELRAGGGFIKRSFTLPLRLQYTIWNIVQAEFTLTS